jgi:cytochrome P450
MFQRRTFSSDPISWLEEAAAGESGVRWMSKQQLCVFDAATARQLLSNEAGDLIDHSDFFGAPGGALQPRDAQVALAREAIALVQRHLKGLDLAARVDRLPSRSRWPETGNALLLDLMRPVLAAPDRSPRLQAVLDRVTGSRIARRRGPPRNRIVRAIARFRTIRAILLEMESPRPGEARDILDIIGNPKWRMPDEAVTHLYTAFIFALVGSIAFALAWSLLLAARHGHTQGRTADLVREALRLYPVAWLLERQAIRPIDLMGERVLPTQSIVIASYAIHRNPRYWSDAAAFRPERWQGRIDRSAWLPFGAGGQSCVAASLTIDLVARLLDILLSRGVRIEGGTGQPSLGAALAPPDFILLRD